MENSNKTVSNAQALLDVRTPVMASEIIKSIKDNVKEGKVNPLEAYTVLKKMKKVSEEVLEDEDIKRMAETEFEKYTPEKKGSKTITVFGAGIVKCPTYTWYDFKQCGHIQLDALYEIQEHVKSEIKRIEDELKLMIPKDDYKPGQIPGFGIENTTRQMMIEHIPAIIYKEINEVVPVEPPKKIQNLGLKYMKL